MLTPPATLSGLTDQYARSINYLRVSLTDKCNLNCGYCVSNKPVPKLRHEAILRYEEILRIIRVGADHGLTKIRITGGEPLVRKDINIFIEELCSIDALTDVSITTNGVALEQHLVSFQKAGIKRLNISLDTLFPDRFYAITGKDRFRNTWQSLMAALELGFDPIKINVVALGGINDDEFLKFAELTYRYPFHVRFIEYMPIGSPKINPLHPVLIPEIKTLIRKHHTLCPVETGLNAGPATLFQLKNSIGKIGFISPISNHFCDRCNRLRLTANGHLRPCLLSDKQIDIATPMRTGCSDTDIYRLLKNTINLKQKHHTLHTQKNKISSHMSAIGG